MAEPVRARRLTDDEGHKLTQIVRRGRGHPIRIRRATIILAHGGGPSRTVRLGSTSRAIAGTGVPDHARG